MKIEKVLLLLVASVSTGFLLYGAGAVADKFAPAWTFQLGWVIGVFCAVILAVYIRESSLASSGAHVLLVTGMLFWFGLGYGSVPPAWLLASEFLLTVLAYGLTSLCLLHFLNKKQKSH